MNVETAYNAWAAQYDNNQNKTRDLEKQALRAELAGIQVQHCLEIGCGTGKNSAWLVEQAATLTAVDLSPEMLARAREKVQSPKAEFIQADILAEWNFAIQPYDLITFSLVLEHIRDLEAVFVKASAVLTQGGYLYIGELHPFKQYQGSKARFETPEGLQVVECYQHHISDFINAGRACGLKLVQLNEYFDEGEEKNPPRILALLLQKS